ncbi:MAG: DUF1178 family protein [Novosphingobium sp.]
MIVFDLQCRAGHRFEGWFSSSEDYDRQHARALVTCPQCGEHDIVKAPMAPKLARKGNQIEPLSRAPSSADEPGKLVAQGMPAEVRNTLQALATIQAEAIKNSRWVGKTFAEDARAMHYGEREAEAIHGQATPDQARALLDEGIEIAPLIVPVAPPDQIN